ncbi:MAG TPA: thioredoxin domain-containing protein [Planctomycetaceae bacterium]|nr:thioredoxin domain-containing protein [Planctomycetaceae bacterium]
MAQSTRQQPNRLAGETSPYLLQHAYNPVDWHPWGEEALAAARERDRPIFLSIGYSACHWCHVMEHESFEDPAIAELMNRWFVNVKVDREERPDLDQIYMNAVIALSGHGGWPMSVFLTPELKPFFGGTYWPPHSRMGMPGFRDILQKVREAWESRRPDVDRGADELTAVVAGMGLPRGEPARLGAPVLEQALRALLRSADRQYGGFGGAPKFPHPMDLRVLLRAWKRFGSRDALDVVTLTLDRMARGGIYDHLGGGFHRYSTDARWLVPHFEKMLYDNALLIPVYVEAHQATGNADFARVVRETAEYVLREMTQPEGGFFSTQDADSEGVEGKFFVWTAEEVERQLGPEDARIFSYCYDVTPEGNWRDPHGHAPPRASILNRIKTHAQAAKMLAMAEDDLADVLERCRRKLFDVRSERVPPGRDEKLLVSWNGLMIAALAQAGRVLGESRYTDAARRAADFLLENLRGDEGRLLHSYKDGRARFNAYLDDYACLIDGLAELYQATFDAAYVEAALELAEVMRRLFHDAGPGGFFYTSADHEPLIARYKDTLDNATPSGNAMAATALLKLARLTGRTGLEDLAVDALDMLSGQVAQMPSSGGQSLIALDFLLGPSREVVVVDGERPDETGAVFQTLHARFLPNLVLLRRRREIRDEDLPAAVAPLLAGKAAAGDAPTVYLCERGACRLPVTDVEGLTTALDPG